MDKDLKTMSALSCRKTKKLISPYSQDLLSPEWSERVKEHLSACSECRDAYDQTQGILNLLGKDRVPDPGEVFWKDMSSRIMSEVRQVRSEPGKISWTRKIWGNPFSWPGYAWGTALVLIFLTSILIYTNQSPKPSRPFGSEVVVNEWIGEPGLESLPLMLETLSPRESVRLGNRIVSRLGNDLPKQSLRKVEDEWPGDIATSLEGLNKEELEILINKLQAGRSVGFKEEGTYVA